eukprot:1368783-Amphidinium_carterae.1
MKKACSALVDGHLAQMTTQVVQEMQAKHPQAREEDLYARRDLRVVSAAAVQPVSKEQIRKAITSFPKGSAPGPCGLKPQHLKDALTPGQQELLVTALQQVVTCMLQDKVPVDIKPWLYGATLVALHKPQGGYRPIAVGSALRRLAGKVAIAHAQVPLKEVFEPVQLGVGTSHGCESIVHAVRAWCLDHETHAD